MESLAYELNFESARLAREVCDEITALEPDKPRFVGGSIGPTNRTASISPDVEDASKRYVSEDVYMPYYIHLLQYVCINM